MDKQYASTVHLRGSLGHTTRPFDPVVAQRPYKNWVEGRLANSDLVLRKALPLESWIPEAKARRENTPLMRRVIPPTIVYEETLLREARALIHAGLPLDYADLHRKAIVATEKLIASLSFQPMSKANAGLGMEMARLKQKTLLEVEEEMSKILPGPRGVKITTSPEELVPTPRRVQHANESKNGMVYNEYHSVDGNTYTMRTHVTIKGEARPDVLNILLHGFSEMVKGGSPVSPLGAAGLKLMSSDNRLVVDFAAELNAALTEDLHGLGIDGEEIFPEVE